ncbi:MAG: hypothetical protein HOJ16_00255 [Candidatus Peribacter sp.]|jgi:hypothetical protein|nr:hypothetical protein [Candidatus Peribacter sp.]
MKKIFEHWTKFINEADIDPRAFDLSGLNQSMYNKKYPGYLEKLNKLNLTLQHYQDFSKEYDKKKPGSVVPLDKFVDNIEKIKQMYPEVFGDQQKFSSARAKQRVEKMYNALYQMQDQLVGGKYEKALASLNDLLRSL